MMSDLTNVIVRNAAGNSILTGGNGTLVRNRVTVTGGWTAYPSPDKSYKITSTNRSPLDGKCAGFENGQATFNIQ
jgi:hypothetical protein